MDINSSFSYSSLTSAGQGIQTGSERISSGLRINNAQDDAAGLAISNRMGAEIRGFSQSIRNANDGISMLETASGSLSGITENIQRIRELAIQAGNGTLNSSDRAALNKEAQQLLDEVNRTVETTTFNQQPLLKNSQDVSLQIGPKADDQLTLAKNDFAQKLEDAGFADIDLSSAEGASSALGVLDQVQTDVDNASANIGAESNRLESTINSLSLAEEKASASRSRIRDADMAKETSQLVNEQVREQASINMLFIDNANRGNILKLLGQ